jgi:hypothetical protein
MNEINDLRKNGFIFKNIEISDELISKLYSLPYSEKYNNVNEHERNTGGEYIIPSDSDITLELRARLMESVEDVQLKIAISHMEFLAIRVMPGDFISFHQDPKYSRNGFFHINIWAPKSPYEGRDFIYGTPELTESIHPERGDVVFINDEPGPFIHGVRPFISGEPNISINGYVMDDSHMGINSLNSKCTYFGGKQDLINGYVARTDD